MSYRFEMSEVQKGIYFDCYAGSSNDYNIVLSLKVKKLEINTLEYVINLAASEQETLHLNVYNENDEIAFQYNDQISVKVACVKSRDNQETENLAKTFFLTPFDMSTAPLLKVEYIEEKDNYYLLVCMHHLIADGISADIFIKRVFEIYHGMIKGTPFSMEIDNNKNFSAFVETENEKMLNGEYDIAKKYWLTALEGITAPELIKELSNLNAERVKAEVRIPVAEELNKKVVSCARNLEVSEFMLQTTIFMIALMKYSQNSNFAITTPFTYRPTQKDEETMGCYIYNYPVFCKTNEGEHFSQLARNVKNDIYMGYMNAGYPSNLIARELNFKESEGANIFNYTFIYDFYEEFDSEYILGMKDWSFSNYPGELTVIYQKLGEDAQIRIQFNEADFSREYMNSFGNRMIKIMEQVVVDPEILIGDISVYLDSEEKQIEQYEAESSFFPYVDECAIDIFEQKVRNNSDAIAVVTSTQSYTYEQINSKANVIARELINIDQICHEKRVAIYLERTVEMVITVLGILKAGWTYVPMDISYTDQRMKYIKDDANLQAVFTSKKFHSRLQEVLDIPILAVENVLVDEEKENVYGDRNPSYAAYIEYTSGTTGEPKGVVVENRNVTNTVKDLDRRFPLGKEDVYLFKTSITFDISGTEIYGWIVGDGKLCILNDGEERDVFAILDAIQDYQVTHINFVPSMLKVFVDCLENKENKQKIKNLKWIFTGGEAIDQGLVDKFLKLRVNTKLENVYGPTEATMWATHYSLRDDIKPLNVPIGKALNEYKLYVVNKNMEKQPFYMQGELCISGAGVARGYLNKQELTNQVFVENPFWKEGDPEHFKRLYRTGDLARMLPDGNFEFLGRIDSQVKINGMRVELGEIENVFSRVNGVSSCACVLSSGGRGDKYLVLFYTAEQEILEKTFRDYADNNISAAFIPSRFIRVEEMPRTLSEKIDRKALIKLAQDTRINKTVELPTNELEIIITDIWKEVLERDDIGINENFFESGGHSISLVRVHNALCKKLNMKFPISILLNNPTIKGIARAVSNGDNLESEEKISKEISRQYTPNADIAIIGMAINVPGASSIHEFWNNLVEGKECIHDYTEEELREIGIEEDLINNPHYVRRKGRINDIDSFDPAFFEVTPAEVRMMSPQLRVLYKGVWQALEDAGESNEKYKDSTGVYIGASDDFVWYQDRMFNNERYSDTYQIYTQSTNHFLATRMSYMFDLMGPAMSVLTGCSTSLVTVHLACKALQNNECKIALAGGVTIELPNEGGYLYEPNLMFSKDGKCKPFDDRADGTVFSNGMGIVVLKRLDDAKRDNDHIYAVIKGSAIRNDGRAKLSYTAPSANGQAITMKAAYEDANIDPRTITYVEAHGTGTKLGDPIEVDSLTRIFGSADKPFCTLGSVKGNIGHTDTAAGIIGLIKTALSLEHQFIPATVNYEIPNSNIDFENSPFEIRNYGMEWDKIEESIPRRAGVNAFGVGGTNVHMILEENDKDFMDKKVEDKKYNLFVMSAKSQNALKANLENMCTYAKSGYMKGNKADTAWTLLTERRKFNQRGYIVTENDNISENYISETTVSNNKKICFMFTGQGSQYQGMAKELIDNEDQNLVADIFRKKAEILLNIIPEAEREEYRLVIYGNENPDMINQTKYSQVALFITEYAMAETLRELGVEPDVLIGHSIGEVAAAAFAGVWNLEDAIRVVMKRASLMQKQDSGSMLSVSSSREKIEKYVNEDECLWISLNNTTGQCVVGGYKKSIEALKEKLTQDGIQSTVLKTSHAFHTPMMDGAAKEFKEFLNSIEMREPKYPIISNLTGEYATEHLMDQPSYWADQITNPVEFERVLDNALDYEETVFYELGGKTLSSLAKKHTLLKEGQVFVPCIRHPREKKSDIVQLLGVIGKTWSCGIDIKWDKVLGEEHCKVYAPAYQFEKKDFPIKLKKIKMNGESVAEEETSEHEVVVVREDDILNIVKNAYVEIFGMDKVEDSSDFFEVGGDSMQAASLAAKLKKETNQQMSVSEIFSNPTPIMIAEAIKKMMKENPIPTPVTKIPKAKTAQYYPTTPAQKRMYMLYAMNKLNLAFNLPSVTLIQGNLDLEKSRETYQRLLDRHDILRTSFEMKDEEIVQIIHDKCELPFEVEKIKGAFDIQAIAKEFVRPFSLDQAPLMRVKLVQNETETLMLFDVHHIIADGTSVELLTRDFNELYSGELEPAEIQYKDYAVWLNDNQMSETMKKQEEYWLGNLKDNIPYLELPTDYPRPAMKSFSGKRYEFDFGDELSTAINKRSRELGVTNNILVMSAWNIVLSKFAQQEDVIIGTSVSGRSIEDIEQCIGMFVNMLVIRTAPEGEKKYLDYLSEVKKTVASALENQNYQFDMLVEKLNVPRRLDHNALFDVGFDYHNIELHDLEIEGITFEQQELDTGRVSNEVLLTCIENNEHHINGFLDYCTALFSEETIKILSESLLEVIIQITGTEVMKLENVNINEINITSENEKSEIEKLNSVTHRERNYSKSISGLFEDWVAKQPEKTAIVTCDGVEHSYRKIQRMMQSIASNLLSAGVKENDNVVLIPKRDETMVAAMFAILSVKATYVPVDITYPDQRIAEIITQSESNVILADDSVRDRIPEGIKFLNIHECATNMQVNQTDTSIGEDDHNENRIAYILFTSGSTGGPKGVRVSRKNLLNFIYDTQERKLVGEPEDRILCITSPSFDIFGYESVTPLCSGSSIYICDQIEQIDAQRTGSKIQKYKVTHMLSSVSRLKSFVENRGFAGALKSLKCILGGGENYPVSLLKFLQENTNARIYNLYGPTETTIWSTAKELTESDSVTIGSAIANTKLYILDSQNRVLPRGVFGELCIAGDGVSKGYLNCDEENRKHFVTCEEISDSVIYKTGDKGRMLLSGEVELAGRMDYQVKHHGCRIELTEIENAVINGYVVEDAIAVLKKNDSNAQLFLFYVDINDKESAIRKYISENLPVYMIPDRIVRLKSTPLNHNGKTDRKYLENTSIEEIMEKYGDNVETVIEKAIPKLTQKIKNDTTVTSEDILAIWKDVLHNDKITENSNFFEVGGNSYSLMLVSNKITELLGESVDMLVMFEYPTVASFSEYMHLGKKKENSVQETIEEEKVVREVEHNSSEQIDTSGKIAIIGMAGRFPGASNVDIFWKNIEQGKESIRHFQREELLEAGISEELIENDEYVKAKGYLDGVEYFDSQFFEITKHDANMMDPQIRLLLQCCYNAIEDANIVIDEYQGDIALFAGSSSNLMWMTNFSGESDIVDVFSEMTANDKDFLTTQISYKLNLTGPSINVQTACSTSLVAICQAAQCLLNQDADVALAGGVSVTLPRKEGYMWHENMIYSKDGHCRPFSKDASGTVAGNGCGIVVLKPLEKAIEDKDDIYAVLEGFAINNDGLGKVGYSAPSITGQKKVIEKALKRANVSPEKIGYVETHGTGTKIGDPIELKALNQAWSINNTKSCALGSVKANVGHLDAAAGVAGFIKAVKVMNERVIPPMVNFVEPNEYLYLDSTPFYIPETEKKLDNRYTNVAVSAFGIGGTNAHTILGEAPKRDKNYRKDEIGLFLFSAKTEQSLRDTYQAVIEDYFEKDLDISDVAYTLSTGRKMHPIRTILVASPGITKEQMVASIPEETTAHELTRQITLFTEDNAEMCEFGRMLMSAKAKHESVRRFRKIITNSIEENNDNIYGEFIENILYSENEIKNASYPIEEIDYVSEVVRSALQELLEYYGICQVIKDKNEDAYPFFDDSYIGNRNSTQAQCSLLEMLGKLWMMGADIEAKKLNIGQKIHIHGYVFEKEVCKADVSIKRNQREEIKVEKTFETEEQVFEVFQMIWESVLGEKAVEPDCNFFDAGGDSLVAIRMSALIEKYYGVKVSQDKFFEKSTAGEISQLIFECINEQQNCTCNDVIVPLAKQQYYEVSAAQKRQYILQTTQPDSTAYNLAAAYIVDGKIDKANIKKAVELLIQRHESLRTSFEVKDEKIVQIIHENVKPPIEFVECFDAEKTIGEYMEEYVKPFYLEDETLFRMKIVSISNTKHYLLLDMHHIISDQSSIEVLMRDFYILYQGKELQPLGIQYKDFAAWQNRELKDEKVKEQLDYWIGQIDENAVQTNVYHDYAIPKVRTYEGKKMTFEMPQLEKVDAFAKEQGVTPYMVMFTTLELLLWKYTQQNNFIIGTGIEGRSNEQLHELVGMFVNTLPICARVDVNRSIKEQLQETKQRILEMFNNQDCQYDAIVEEFRLRTGITEPLIKVLMNFVSRGTEELSMEGLNFTPYESEKVYSKFDLMFTIERTNAKYSLHIEYASELFYEETIEQIGRRFLKILELAMKDENISLSELVIPLTKKDFNAYELAQCFIVDDDNKSIVERFEDVVAQYPEYVALEHKGKTLTYEEFNRVCNNLALQLQKMDVKRHDRVALILNPSFAQLVAIFATLKCGACYVPVDVNYPAERIKYMLQDSEAKVVIMQENCIDLIDENIEKIIIDDDTIEQSKMEKHGVPARTELSIDDEAYIIYTSGSTGNPKGVSVNGRSILRIAVNPNFNQIAPGECMPQIANYAFDASIFEIFTAMLNGGYNLIIPKNTLMNLEELSKELGKQKVNSMFFTSALFNLVVDYDISLLKNIERIFVGGEALSVNHVKKALKVLGKGRLFNGYGPTETTVFATTFPINEVEENAMSIPIGFAVTNTKLYVMDEQQRLLPPGMIGELWVGGTGVANGYINNEELTKERFKTVMVNGQTDRIYKTGDRVILHENGEIVYLGRTDFQVKINGFRIELSEIENQFEKINGIKESVILVTEDQRKAKSIAAYYTVENENYEHLTSEYIRNYLQAIVPKYLIPAKIFRVKEIPLNANKKVDRKRLLKMENEQIPAKNTSNCKMVLEVMREVLENDNIQENDNFFLSGGTSIKAIVMSQKLKAEGYEVSVNDILTHTSAKSISEFLGLDNFESVEENAEKNRRKADMNELEGIAEFAAMSSDILRRKIQMEEDEISFPMTEIQKLHLQTKDRASAMSMEFTTNKNIDEVKEIIITEIQRHQILHSIADINNQEWNEKQRSEDIKRLAQYLYVVDAVLYEKESVEQLKDLLYQKLLKERFASGEVMWRIGCIKESERKYVLIWAFDHICFDGMSALVIKNDLSVMLESALLEKEAQKYSDYANSLVKNLEENRDNHNMKENFEKWYQLNQKCIGSFKEIAGKEKEIDLYLPCAKLPEDPVNQLLEKTYEFLKSLIDTSDIPIMILKDGRRVKEKQYYDCVGEFLDFTPVVLNQSFVEENAGRQLDEYGECNLLQDLDKNNIFLERNENGVPEYILWNFQGHQTNEDRNIYSKTFKNTDKQMLAIVSMAVGLDEEGLYLHIESVNGFDMLKVVEAIKNTGFLLKK